MPSFSSQARQGLAARCAALAFSALLLAGLAAPAAEAGVRFDPGAIPIESKNLFDLGVTDLDRDGRTDVFTTNHSQISSLLINRGGRGFAERVLVSGFDQSPEFPGLSDLTRPPERSRPGLYIYALPEGRYEVRRVGGFAEGAEVRGELRFRSAVGIIERSDAEVAIDRNRGAEPPITKVAFQLPAEGSRVTLDVPFLDVPVKVEIEPPVAPELIFVGSRAVNPSGRSFTLRLPDRHGVAIADLNGDGLRDAWIVSGGNKGQIERYGGLIEDELLINNGTVLEDRREQLGVEKGLCRGRTAEVVDFDADGLPDLFASCAGSTPNLYRQELDGGFADVSDLLAGNRDAEGSEYRWVNVNGSRRPELIVGSRDGYAVLSYRPKRGSFERLYGIPRPSGGSVRRLVAADFDADADLDIFASSPSGSSLLLNAEGRLRRRDPRSIGLPSGSAAAAWVDYNNDGRTDLHTVPDGLFRQRGDGSFVATGLAALPEAGSFYAPTVWFDVGGDGDRDMLSAYKRGDELERGIALRVNKGGRNHWLHVDLTGSGRNSDAIGAQVRLRAGGKRLFGIVGESDSSRHSRGDYRLYFGLGGRDRVDRLAVRWPDGSRTVRRNLRVDRVISLRQ